MPLNPRTTPRRIDHPERAFQNFVVDRPGRIIIVGHHLSAKTHIRCLVRHISLYGALLEVSPYLTFPSNFFLEIVGIKDEIGCTVISREEEFVTVGFNMLIAQEFLTHVIRLGNTTTH